MTHPLARKRIVVTRPEAQSRALLGALHEAGAEPILFPTIEIAALDDTLALDSALRRILDYDWLIFTSVNGVRLASERLRALGLPSTAFPPIAVIGPATGAALAELGLRASLEPSEYVAEAIYAELAARGPIAGQRFLLLRADLARATLREQLIEAGGLVDEIAVYQTRLGHPEVAAFDALRQGVDAITFTSSSTLRNFFALLGDQALPIAQHALIACIGPITAQTARELGLTVGLVAETYTIPGLVAALTAHYRVLEQME